MTLHPKHSMVLIKRSPEVLEPKSPSGLLFLPPESLNPEHKHFTLRKGKVEAVGPGKYAEKTGVFIPTTTQVGWTVIYASTQATEFFVPPNTYYDLVPEHEVPCALED